MAIDVSKISRYAQPSDSVGFLLRQLFMAWRRRLEAGLSEIDLTHIQFVMLMGLAWLTRADRSVSQGELTRFCRCSRALASQTLSTLLRKGLIEQVEDPADRRAKQISLTRAGEKKVRQATPLLESTEAEFLAADPALRTRLDRDLRRALKIQAETADVVSDDSSDAA